MKTARIFATLLLLVSLASTAGGALAAEGDIVHTVRVGDNLLLLSNTYGVTGNRIRAANPGWTDPNLMHPGDKLTIPVTRTATPSVSTPFFYTVAAGENSLGIALKFEIDHQALARANGSKFYPFTVAAGQELLVPAGPHLHIVRAGETLSGIAAAFCTNTDVLARFNNVGGGGVFTGQQILIPIHYNAKPCPRGPVAPAGAAAPAAAGGAAAAAGGPLILRGVFISNIVRDPANPPNGALVTTRVEFRGGTAPFDLFNDGFKVGSGLTPASRVEGDVTYAVLTFDQGATCPVTLNHTIRVVSADGQAAEMVYFIGPADC